MENQNFILNKKDFKSYNKKLIIFYKFFEIFKIYKILYIKNKKLYNILIILILIIIVIYSYIHKNELMKYKNFINDCNELKRLNQIKIKHNRNPFVSICIPVYNMENYIERSVLSIINQSFQDFEIIIVNDNSNDNTEKIIKNLQKEDNRIKIVTHKKNLGVYSSRVEAITIAKGEYVILIDPDDMILNEELLQELYNYNLIYKLDMIEFSVFHKREEKKTVYFPNNHKLNHFHKFKKKIIYQPELSNIIFYKPNTYKYSEVICRTIWNKIIRRNILLKTIDYIQNDFKNKFLITADDTPINIINFNFARNYSNINLPGYLYNIRKNSMSNGKNGKKHDIIVSINYLLYYKFLYRYIKDFNKDLNFLYYDIKQFSFFLTNIIKLNITEYIPILIDFYKNIINEKNISKQFKKYIISINLKIKYF